MKKITGTILVLTFLMAFSASICGQQKKGTKPTAQPANSTESAAKKRAVLPVVTIGNSGFTGGAIKPADFNALLKQGIYSHDPAGNNLSVVSFNFIYFEKNFYEDSAGEVHMMMDLSKEYCSGNMISDNISASIYDRIKGGDTVVIDQVLLTKSRPGQAVDTFLGKSVKSFIIK